MHKEKVKYYDKEGKLQECEADTFDTVVHLTKGTKHALKDIERLLKEEERIKASTDEVRDEKTTP